VDLSSASGLTTLPGAVPRPEIIYAGDLVVWGASERVGELGLRISASQLGGLSQGIGDFCGAATGLKADKQIVFPSDRYRSHPSLRYVVI
jgi:hypothetical protein